MVLNVEFNILLLDLFCKSTIKCCWGRSKGNFQKRRYQLSIKQINLETIATYILFQPSFQWTNWFDRMWLAFDPAQAEQELIAFVK